MDDHAVKLMLAGVVVGIVEALKQAGMATKFAALVSIVAGGLCGVVLGIALGHTGAVLLTDALGGLAIGAAATGTYAVADKVGGEKPVTNVTTTGGNP